MAAVPPRRGPVSTTRHDERQSLITKPTTQKDDDSAHSDSDTTVPYAPGTGPTPMPEAGSNFWRD